MSTEEYYKKVLYQPAIDLEEEEIRKIKDIINDMNAAGGNVNIHMVASLLTKRLYKA